ncbi:MAG: transposase, partial [Alphaproteobacteria bacterium]|nr:transposase [Alphaproteobacteria bacterium]
KATPDVKLLVCEATGGYENHLLATAAELAITSHRSDPFTMRQFAKSLRRMAKTDKIDAISLARYGQERAEILPHWTPPSLAQQKLQKLSNLRENLVANRVQYINQSKAPGNCPETEAVFDRVCSQLTKEIEGIEAIMDEIIAADQELKTKFDTIRSVKGCGDATARMLLANLAELGHTNRKRIASLAGLAPHPHQSGESSWKRPMAGGRQVIKKTMFIAALSACRYNPKFKEVYQRLVGNGKAKRLAILAVARQMLSFINFLLSEKNITHHA